MITITALTVVCLSLFNNVHTAEGRTLIFASPGEDVQLPCHLRPSDTISFGTFGNRIRWVKMENDNEVDVLLSMGFHKVKYERFEKHVQLQEANENDASLVIKNLRLDDFGIYKCEVMNGMDDVLEEVEIHMNGVVFPYQPKGHRYNLTFSDAGVACLQQGAVLASFEQLYQAWKGGLDWCNAGWLSDGTVQYPINKPRIPCGGRLAPGIRSYGRQNKNSQFDAFCYTSGYNGEVFFVDQKLNFNEAVQVCHNNGAKLAKVGHMYAAWKLEGYDRCDAGWMEDGSVRYPIYRPRMKCSPTEAAIRHVGYPSKNHKLYGAYCFRAPQ